MIALILATIISGQAWPAPPVMDATGVNGAARITTDVQDVTIGPVVATGAYRAIETSVGADVTRLHVTGLTATGLQRDGIRLRRADDIIIERFDLRHTEARSTGSHLPEGIAITAGRNITIREGRVSGFRMVVVPGKYTNGDGIATEGATSGRIDRVIASDNSDGGFDIKGTWQLNALVAERNSRNFRFWNQVTAGTLTSRDGGTAVWLGKGAVVTIERLVASSVKPSQVIALEGATHLTIKACDLSGMAKGSTLIKVNASGNQVSLGVGCTLP